MPSSNNSNRPVHTVRYRNIKATVWLNQTAKGAMHNVTVSRSYKTDGQDWRNSSSFGQADLLPLAKALNDAHSWIHQQMTASRKTEGGPRSGSRR